MWFNVLASSLCNIQRCAAAPSINISVPPGLRRPSRERIVVRRSEASRHGWPPAPGTIRQSPASSIKHWQRTHQADECQGTAGLELPPGYPPPRAIRLHLSRSTMPSSPGDHTHGPCTNVSARRPSGTGGSAGRSRRHQGLPAAVVVSADGAGDHRQNSLASHSSTGDVGIRRAGERETADGTLSPEHRLSSSSGGDSTRTSIH